LKESWFDPRTGKSLPAGVVPNRGEREFDPSGKSEVGNNWVLILDDTRGHNRRVDDLEAVFSL
jgi:hypothetical protein